MYILDLSQVATANMMVQTQAWKATGHIPLNPDRLRHMILETILNTVKHFKHQYGKLIIACDTGDSWRKMAFPYYKGNRSAGKNKMVVDWGAYFKFLNSLQEEIKENFPYLVINVNHAEGDDVIGTLVRYYQDQFPLEEIMIVSGDKDFKQLHNDRTRQYSPILKTYLGVVDPELDLKIHVIKGDSNDGVPNILSADDCLVLKVRQTKMSPKRLKHFLETPVEDYKPLEQRNWHRNKLMIDLSSIPQRLQDQIMEAYHQQTNNPTRNQVFNYLIKNRLKDLQAAAGEF